MLVACACDSPTSTELAPTPVVTEAPAKKQELQAELQTSLQAALKKANPGMPDPGPAPTMGKNGEPDLRGETSCVTWRWTTINPEWRRDPLSWDGSTRTLVYEGNTKRFDASGRVRDFGQGSAQLRYDDAGNVTFRGEDKPRKELTYHYRNKYDGSHRLTRVELALQAVGDKKPGPYEPHRVFRYDEHGRIVHLDIQVRLRGPLVPAELSYDTHNKLMQIEWKGSPETQLERFEYDAQGRLAKYERDGIVLAGGIPRDGVLDWQQWWTYDEGGRVIRVEAVDGPDPAKAKHDITLFSPACTELGRFVPDLLLYPYIPLPEAATPRWVP